MEELKEKLKTATVPARFCWKGIFTDAGNLWHRCEFWATVQDFYKPSKKTSFLQFWGHPIPEMCNFLVQKWQRWQKIAGKMRSACSFCFLTPKAEIRKIPLNLQFWQNFGNLATKKSTGCPCETFETKVKPASAKAKVHAQRGLSAAKRAGTDGVVPEASGKAQKKKQQRRNKKKCRKAHHIPKQQNKSTLNPTLSILKPMSGRRNAP